MILIVEDYEDWQLFLSSALKQAGFSTLVASSAEEGLAILSANSHIRLLITDLGLPNMQGDELITHVRNSKADLPIIVFSSNSDTLIVAQRMGAIGIEKGCADVHGRILKEVKNLYR
jgi:two-component system OmpR family response regulator